MSSSLLVLVLVVISPFTSGCVQTTISLTTVSMIGHYTNTTCCGFLCWGTCHANESRILYATQYVISYKCCLGYGPGYPECYPICNDTCEANMVCSAPDACTCAPGWTGDDCVTDIDECQKNTDQCEDNCINIPGLYLCTCSNNNDVLAPSNKHRCLSPVTNLHSIPANNRTLELTWTLPNNYEQDGNLTGLNITCSRMINSTKSQVVVYFTNVTTSFDAHSLLPFKTYTCCITPQWGTIDEGPPTCINSTTTQEAPSDSPYNVTVQALTSSTLYIQWEPPLIPNGIINTYILYINYTNGSSLVTKTINALFTYTHLEELFPYQLVGISMSATTDGGEGPKTEYIFSRTKQSEPYEVTKLNVLVLLSSTIKVTWYAPLIPNGVITSYWVRVTSITIDKRFKKEESITPQNEMSDFIAYFTGLEPYVPYSAQVTAVNLAGEGKPIDFVFYTLQTVPSISPSITSATRKTPTSVQIIWSEMSLEESRGFITQYNLFIVQSIERCDITLGGDDSEGHNVTANTTEYLFTELETATNYCISIEAYTEVGRGEVSQYSFVGTYEKSEVSVFFSGVHNCPSWREINTQSKLDKLDDILLRVLLLNCSCSFTEDFIFGSHFDLCMQEMLVYRTFVLGMVAINSSRLVNIIEEWARKKPTVVVEGVKLRTEVACSSTEYQSCEETEETTNNSTNTGTIVISGFGALCLLLAVCILIIVITLAIMKKNSKGRRQNGRYYRPQDIGESDIELQAMERFSKLGKETSI